MSERKKLLYRNGDSSAEYAKICHMLRSKYYNLFMSNYKWTGLDYRQTKFIMNEFWDKGSVAAFKIKGIDELGFAPWTRCNYDMYGEAETVILTNLRGSPLIPTSVQIVDKDVVLGWIQSNRKPFKMVVDWYIERIAQIEMVINTNVQLHKIPFLIPVEDSKEMNKILDICQRILNGELIIGVEGIDPSIFKSVATNVPYIIDKLKNYETTLENELKTIMGINNPGVTKIEQLQMSEVNANNGEIRDFDMNYEHELKDFCQRVSEVLKVSISVEVFKDPEIHEMPERSYDVAPGPKAEEEE